jgi:3-carboxy-cis,cis-muconate cycloisomerase
MPGKRNPVLATLVRAQALSLPSLAAQLHRCAADMHSQRPAGAWHAEWSPLRELVRGALVVVDQTADLLVGLEVDVAAMTDRVAQQQAALTGERDAMARLSGNAPDESYLGQSDLFVDAVLERARRTLGKGPA